MEAGGRAPIRVIVVDDHPMVRDMVRMGCEERPGIEFLGGASDGQEALDQCRVLQPDVLILDLNLPGLDGFEVIRELRAEGNPVRILVLSGRDDREAVFEAVRLGVDGYLEKTMPVEQITAAVEAIASGAKSFSVEHERLAYSQLGHLARRARETARAASVLTKREREVLGLLTMGLTSRQMASRLGRSERTVETHISNIYQKLEVGSRVQALRRAADLGLAALG
jgi:DNA-binding NarL/FixJ family response regulator